MKLSVIFDDARVVKDGLGYEVMLPSKPEFWAIQWNGETGHIEYRDPDRLNEAIPNDDRPDAAVFLAPYMALWQAAHALATAEPVLTFEDRRAVKVSEARAQFEGKVATGWPFEGLHVEINDGARANLGGLALTAFLASQQVTPWPADYGRGWVSIEGVRIPLTPQTAIPFAASAGAYYSALVQHEQDLEDALLAAESDAALAAVDLTDGWPT